MKIHVINFNYYNVLVKHNLQMELFQAIHIINFYLAWRY